MIGDDIEITIVDIRGDKVRLGITAPAKIPVHRKEVYEAIRRENQEAARVKLENLPPGSKPPSLPPQSMHRQPNRPKPMLPQQLQNSGGNQPPNTSQVKPGPQDGKQIQDTKDPGDSPPLEPTTGRDNPRHHNPGSYHDPSVGIR